MRKVLLVCGLWVFLLSGCASMFGTMYGREGWVYYREGEVEKAVQYFTGNLTGETLCPACLCKIYSETGQYEKAVKSCEDALQTWKLIQRTEYGDVNEFFEDNLLFEGKAVRVGRLSDAYEHTGQFGRAIEVMKQWVTADNPNDSGGFSKLSYLYIHNKQYDEAITAAKRAIELKSANAPAYVNLAYAYSYKNQRSEALHAVKKAIELDPSNAQYRGDMGGFLLEWDDYAEAAEAYRKAVELQPSSIGYLIGLASSLRLMGRYDDAMISVNKIIEFQTIRGIGTEIAVEEGRPIVKKVMEDGPAKKADLLAGDTIFKIDNKPTRGLNPEQVAQAINGVPGTQVVLTIKRKGVSEPLQKLVTREVIIEKSAAASFANRSLLYRYKGNREESFKDAEKASSLDSANNWARFSLGAAYLDRGNYEESIKALSQVKEGVHARILEATSYAKRGDMKAAENVYFSIPAEKLSPKNIPLMTDRMALLQVFKPVVKVRRDNAKSFEARNMHKEALSALSEALKIADDSDAEAIQEDMFNVLKQNPRLAEAPEEAREYALRGEVLVKEGNFSQAVTEFKKAIRIAPYVARLYYNCAQVCAEIKNYSEAIRHMKMYLKLVADAPDARKAKDDIITWKFMMERASESTR